MAAEGAAELLPEQAKLGAEREDLLDRAVVEVEAESCEPALGGLDERALPLGAALQQPGTLGRRREPRRQLGGERGAHPVGAWRPDDECAFDAFPADDRERARRGRRGAVAAREGVARHSANGAGWLGADAGEQARAAAVVGDPDGEIVDGAEG